MQQNEAYYKVLAPLGCASHIDTFRAVMELKFTDLTGLLRYLGLDTEAVSSNAQLVRRHLILLNKAGLVTIFQSYQGNEYSPNPEGIKHFLALMNQMCS